MFKMTWQPGSSFDFVNTKVYEYTHADNGLRVLLCPVPDSKVCAYMRAVKAGSKEEADFVPMGMAHFLEHMSFRIQDGKIWSLASKGDVINAETNMDSTRFYVVHLPEQTPQTIAIDADRFKQTAVPAEKIPVEVKAVLNELERGQQAGNKMFQTTSSVAILEHPYHHSTIGTKTDVQKSTAVDMQHFRQKYYVPNNTTLIFAGAFEPAHVLNLVHENFGDMPKGLDCHPVHTPEPPQMGKRSIELNIDAPCPMVCMAFHQPKGSTKESLVLQCISRLTWQNEQGRAKSLIDENTLHDVSTYSPRQIDPYLWFFHGTQENTSPEIRLNIEKKMLAVLQSFAVQKVSESTLTTIKSTMLDDWHRSLESVTDMMNELGRGASMGNWKDFADREATLGQITPTDIQTVAADIFKPTNMTVTHIIPTKNASGTIVSSNAFSVAGETAPAAAADIPIGSSTNVAWKVNNISPTTNILHVPRASYVRVTLSARFSPAEHDIASIMTASMGKGTVSKGQSTTSALLNMHTERSFTHGHEFIHMTMSMPSTTSILQKASNMMFNNEWLKPTFSSKVVELQKRRRIAEMNALKNDQGFQTKKHFIQGLFEKTLYHIPIDVRVQRTSNISVKDVHDFHSKWVGGNNSTYVTMVTPTTETAATLGQIFPAHESEPNTTLEWTPKPRQASEKHVALPGFGSFQIMMGQTVAAKPFTKEHVALECAAEILGGGMTGRLMHTVREQRGLGTYGIYSLIQTISTKTPSIFCVQGTFSPSSIKEGLACTKELVAEWSEHGVTPLELNNAKERLVGSKVIASDTVDNLHSMVLKDILEKRSPEQSFEEYKSTVQQLTLQDVNSAIQTFIDPTKFVSVVVGPPSNTI